MRKKVTSARMFNLELRATELETLTKKLDAAVGSLAHSFATRQAVLPTKVEDENHAYRRGLLEGIDQEREAFTRLLLIAEALLDAHSTFAAQKFRHALLAECEKVRQTRVFPVVSKDELQLKQGSPTLPTFVSGTADQEKTS
jgi:hypothetical protein